MADGLSLADEDTVAEMYLHTSQRLRSAGYNHYEISNFAKDGKESRHNNRYWLGEDYIGIGPSAHSCFAGKRFYYERDFDKFIEGAEVIDDGDGGDSDEYIMLRLRLAQGLKFKEYEKKFGEKISDDKIKLMNKYEKSGFCKVDDEGIKLTPEGFLVSNIIIGEILK
jgi:oxygen-independent coproporphyrinogen-3 oxidase